MATAQHPLGRHRLWEVAGGQSSACRVDIRHRRANRRVPVFLRVPVPRQCRHRPRYRWSNLSPRGSSVNKWAISFRTTMLRLLYLASSSPAASKEAPGGKPIGSRPVAFMPEWYKRDQSHSRRFACGTATTQTQAVSVNGPPTVTHRLRPHPSRVRVAHYRTIQRGRTRPCGLAEDLISFP